MKRNSNKTTISPQPVGDTQIVVIDTETTGFGHVAKPPREDGIIQIGLARRTPGGRIEVWSATCNPGEEFLRPGWADEALGVSGLTRQQVRASPPATEVALQLRRRLRSIRKETGSAVELRAYNRDFDLPFLAAPPWNLPAEIWGPCIMLEATSHLDGPEARWVGLSQAMLRLNLRWPGTAHDAGFDAHAALLVMERVTSRPRISGSDSQG